MNRVFDVPQPDSREGRQAALDSARGGAASHWLRAATLHERTRSLAQAPQRSDASPVGSPSDRAGRRLARWKAQRPFDRDDWFARRLAADGIEESALARLLSETPEDLARRLAADAPWARELSPDSDRRRRDLDDGRPPALDHPDSRGARRGFLELVAPLIRRASARLADRLGAVAARHARLPFSLEPLARAALAGLDRDLLAMITPTLVLELHVAGLGGLLPAETPEGRFRAFEDRLARGELASSIFEEYPVLARLVVGRIDQGVEACIEVAERLALDWPDVAAAFGAPAAPGELVTVDAGAGDAHRGGRSVQLLGWSGGFRVVYKPRPHAVDVHFHRLVEWLDARWGGPPLPTFRVLDRGEYGWVEHVERRACSTPAEVATFYERLGGQLALLYALEATDFHCENLIASGDRPALVDLEALFHRFVDATGAAPDAQASRGCADPFALGEDALTRSVLGVGLLPLPDLPGRTVQGLDLSGVAAPEVQLTPFLLPTWEGGGTDAMRCVRKRMPFKALSHRPVLDGALVEPAAFEADLLRGFERAYATLVDRRAELLADGGPIDAFAHDEVRVLARSTALYALLMQESMHPDVLRDALDRDRLFDRLWYGVEERPVLERLIAFERADLWRGDFPLFTTRPASRDLSASTGATLPGFFAETALARVKRRIASLSAADLERQRWFIRASLAMRRHASESAPAVEPAIAQAGREAPRAPIGRDEVVARARAIGDRLEASALRGDGCATWIGLTVEGGLSPLGLDLGEGAAGVALFLAYLGAVGGDARHTALAEEALESARRAARRPRAPLRAIGAFDGWAGLVHALVHLAALWDRPALVDEATALLDAIAERLDQDRSFDVVGGAAGAVGVLVAFHRATGSTRALDLASRCADHLLAHVSVTARGRSWVPYFEREPLSGFAHGAAGIAWALVELWSVLREPRWLAAARDALAYESTLYDPEAGNWLDLRSPADGSPRQRTFRRAWCHGAPGIGVARLRMLARFEDPALRTDLHAALEASVDLEGVASDCLCHGALGNLELVREASRFFGEPGWRDLHDRRASTIVERIDRLGARSGLPVELDTPGLLTGLAGVGYGLLRIAAPEVVPNVLVLDPPARRRGPRGGDGG